MAFVVESPSAAWGYYVGGDEGLGDTAAFRDPRRPYPSVGAVLELTWLPGDDGAGRLRPDVCCHNVLRDFVCRRNGYDALMELAGHDLHLVAEAVCDDEPLWIVQVVKSYDVASLELSLPEGTGWRWIEWPHVPPEREAEISTELFRLPDPYPPLMVLAGNDLVAELRRRGLTGLTYTEATASGS